MKIRFRALLLATLAMTACSSGNSGTSNEPDPEQVVEDKTGWNASFELGLKGWSVNGDEIVSTTDNAYDGKQALSISTAKAASVTMSQTLTGLDNGTYDLEYYSLNKGGQRQMTLCAGTRMSSPLVKSDQWTRGYVRGIEVKDGTVQVSIVCKSETSSQCVLDGLSLVKSNRTNQTLIKGGDLSELTYVEQNGGKYYDEKGKVGDCLTLLKESGMNLVRLRLYNDPGNPDFTPSNRLPAGIQDLSDILTLAKRAKEAGMQILLTLHLSDYWTNGETQNIPHEWMGLDAEALKAQVYAYTKQVLDTMKAQGTLPEYVAIGNEVQAGLLYPYGACANDRTMCELLNQGCKAVRDAAPDAKVIIHLSGAGDESLYSWFLGLLKTHNVDYDIIGSSYYPFWTGRDAKTVCEWAESVSGTYGKQLLFMETGYAWNPTLPDGTAGQLSNNLPYTEMTKEGQRKFMLELTHYIHCTSSGRVLGYVYWDPIFINVSGANLGWELGGKNVVSNTTLFDFNGYELPVLDALRYNN